MVRELHTAEDFEDIARWLAGSEPYFLQGFKDSGDNISGGYSAYSRQEMEAFRTILLPFIHFTEIRGMDL